LFWKMEANYQVMVLAAVQVGNFMNMVIRGEWWKVKKRNLDLLKLINKSRKKR
jgi:hypothetical protein